MSKDTLTIRRPDDWHLHLRDEAVMQAVLPYSAAVYGRAIIMPNLVPPIATTDAAKAYKERIMKALPKGSAFTPLMTCYLTDTTDADDLIRGFKDKVWVAAKLFPAGATTNSHNGVRDVPGLAPLFGRMEKAGMPLSVHGESVDPTVDIFKRESDFMEKLLLPLLKRHQGLKVIVEHATHSDTLALVREYAPRVAATITPHHLVLNRTDIFQGGLQPYNYCLPVAKAEKHRLAIRKAATSGETCFFLGTDSAPHPRSAKERAGASAGILCAPTALQCYVQAFDEENALDKFEAFASLNGPAFYGMPVNKDTITLRRRPATAPAAISFGKEEGLVFKGGQELPWSIE